MPASLGLGEEEAAPTHAVVDPMALEPGEELWHLTLEEARRIGMQDSISLERSRLQPRIQAAAKTIAQAQFDWILSADTRYSSTKDHTFDQRTTSIGWDNTVAVARYFPTGTRVRASMFYRKSEGERMETVGSLGVRDTAGMTVTVEQNLLRGFGIGPNVYNVELAEIGLQAEESRLAQIEKELIFAIDQAYWNLVFAHEDLKVTANSLQLAREDLEITERKRPVFATDVDVLAAQARLTQKEQELLERQRFIRDRSEQLLQLISPRRLLALLTEQGRRMVLVPADYESSAPEAPSELDVRQAIGTALRFRDELRQAGLNIDAAELSERQASHELMPDLLAVAGITVAGGGRKTRTTFDSLARTDRVSGFVGLEFAVSLNNSAARGQHEQAQLRRRQASYDEQLAQVEVITDVLSAIREIRTTRQTIETAIAGERLSELQVDASTRRLDAGLGTRFELDTRREELDIARRNRLQAEISLRIAQSRLQLATGTIGQRR